MVGLSLVFKPNVSTIVLFVLLLVGLSKVVRVSTKLVSLVELFAPTFVVASWVEATTKPILLISFTLVFRFLLPAISYHVPRLVTIPADDDLLSLPIAGLFATLALTGCWRGTIVGRLPRLPKVDFRLNQGANSIIVQIVRV